MIFMIIMLNKNSRSQKIVEIIHSSYLLNKKHEFYK